MTASTPSRRSNPLGIASLVFGVLLLLTGLAAQVLSPVMPLILEPTVLSFRMLSFLIALPQAIIAVIATVLGIAGLLQRDRARTAAIIGTTLGASDLIVGVLGWIGMFIVGTVFL